MLRFSPPAVAAAFACLLLAGCGRGGSSPQAPLPEASLPEPPSFSEPFQSPRSLPLEEPSASPETPLPPLQETAETREKSGSEEENFSSAPEAETSPAKERAPLPSVDEGEASVSGPPPAETRISPPESAPEPPEADAAPPGISAAYSAHTRSVAIEGLLLEMINSEREQNDLEPLGMVDTMQLAAQIRAAEALDSLSHTRADGTSYHTVFDETGYPYAGKWHGENLAVVRVRSGEYEDKDIADALFAQWSESPGHHKNMLGEHFYQTGVGVHIQADGDEAVIGAAQLFAGL